MKLKTILLSMLLFMSFNSRASTIYQAFDEPFLALEKKLPRLKELGYTYIQISPPQKSLPHHEWWARYQPIDHTRIEGILGSEQELKSLIVTTHRLGMKLLVDTILNHMANVTHTSEQLTYPEFTKEDFHFPDTKPCISNYSDRFQVTHYWLCSSVDTVGLPDLDTSSPRVRDILLKFLEKLIALGADGFRFDAMKHIEPEFWEFLVSKISGRGLYFYGEVIGQSLEESSLYTPFADITDFHLLVQMIKTFTHGGDLRNLYNPAESGNSLKTPTVVFARNHDTVMHKGFYNFGDHTDAMLANAFILGRGENIVSIYRDDHDHPFVRFGLEFRNKTVGLSTRVIPPHDICTQNDHCDPRTLMFISRGDNHLMVINTADHLVEWRPRPDLSLQKGCYEILGTQKYVHIGDHEHSQHESQNSKTPPSTRVSPTHIRVNPRSATFFVPTTSEKCL